MNEKEREKDHKKPTPRLKVVDKTSERSECSYCTTHICNCMCVDECYVCMDIEQKMKNVGITILTIILVMKLHRRRGKREQAVI